MTIFWLIFWDFRTINSSKINECLCSPLVFSLFATMDLSKLRTFFRDLSRSFQKVYKILATGFSIWQSKFMSVNIFPGKTVPGNISLPSDFSGGIVSGADKIDVETIADVRLLDREQKANILAYYNNLVVNRYDESYARKLAGYMANLYREKIDLLLPPEPYVDLRGQDFEIDKETMTSPGNEYINEKTVNDDGYKKIREEIAIKMREFLGEDYEEAIDAYFRGHALNSWSDESKLIKCHLLKNCKDVQEGHFKKYWLKGQKKAIKKKESFYELAADIETKFKGKLEIMTEAFDYHKALTAIALFKSDMQPLIDPKKMTVRVQRGVIITDDMKNNMDLKQSKFQVGEMVRFRRNGVAESTSLINPSKEYVCGMTVLEYEIPFSDVHAAYFSELYLCGDDYFSEEHEMICNLVGHDAKVVFVSE